MNDNQQTDPRVLMARKLGSYYEVPQQKGEDDIAYVHRLSEVLRGSGRIIEAHELRTGKLFDNDPEGDVSTGLMGAVAQELLGTRYPVEGTSQIGTDIAAGVVISSSDRNKEAAVASILRVFGADTGMEILQAFQGNNGKERR